MRFLQILVSALLPFASYEHWQAVFSTASEQRILTSEIDIFVLNLLDDWNSPAGISIAVVQADGTWKTETLELIVIDSEVNEIPMPDVEYRPVSRALYLD